MNEIIEMLIDAGRNGNQVAAPINSLGYDWLFHIRKPRHYSERSTEEIIYLLYGLEKTIRHSGKKLGSTTPVRQIFDFLNDRTDVKEFNYQNVRKIYELAEFLNGDEQGYFDYVPSTESGLSEAEEYEEYPSVASLKKQIILKQKRIKQKYLDDKKRAKEKVNRIEKARQKEATMKVYRREQGDLRKNEIERLKKLTEQERMLVISRSTSNINYYPESFAPQTADFLDHLDDKDIINLLNRLKYAKSNKWRHTQKLIAKTYFATTPEE